METNIVDSYEESADKPRRGLKLMPILGSLMPLGLILVTVIYISIFQKDAVNSFLKKYDFIGVSVAGRAEKDRQYLINNLPIPFEQRQALKQGTIFLGATTDMVLLAIGQPAQAPEKTADGQDKWVYYFQDSSRPTYLFFQGGKLVNAAKGSTLDNAEIQ